MIEDAGEIVCSGQLSEVVDVREGLNAKVSGGHASGRAESN